MPIADYTSEAKTDLRQIVEYLARDDLGAAIKGVAETEGACDSLATRPEIGERARSKRFGEARRHVVGNHLIYVLNLFVRGLEIGPAVVAYSA